MEDKPKSHKPFITAEEALAEQHRADAVRAANPELFKPKAATVGGQVQTGTSGPITTPVSPQARAFTGAPVNPVPVVPASNPEKDLEEHLARRDSNINPKAPGPVSVTRPEWEADKESPAKRATLQKPVVPGMVAMRSDAPQEWKIGTMPAPEPVADVEAVAKPDPKPEHHAANVKKGDGVTFIPKYKKFLAEFDASGQTYHVGMFDSEKQAVSAIATAKANLYA